MFAYLFADFFQAIALMRDKVPGAAEGRLIAVKLSHDVSVLQLYIIQTKDKVAELYQIMLNDGETGPKDKSKSRSKPQKKKGKVTDGRAVLVEELATHCKNMMWPDALQGVIRKIGKFGREFHIRRSGPCIRGT
jgi:hypothetical protein